MIDRFRALPMARSAFLAGRVAADAARNVFVLALMTGVAHPIGFRFHAGPAAAVAAIGLALAVGLTYTHDASRGELRHPRRYEAAVTIGLGGFRRRVFDGLVALSGAGPGERVLDVGCGTGYLARRVALAVGADGSVVGIDPSGFRIIDTGTRWPRLYYLLAERV